MKRDVGLLIAILEALEAREDHHLMKLVPIEGRREDEVMYHQILLAEADFIHCETIKSSTTGDRIIEAYPFEVSWKGHEFLALTRQKAVWPQMKEHFGKSLREAPVETLFSVAKRLAEGLAQQKIAPLLGLEGAD